MLEVDAMKPMYSALIWRRMASIIRHLDRILPACLLLRAPSAGMSRAGGGKTGQGFAPLPPRPEASFAGKGGRPTCPFGQEDCSARGLQRLRCGGRHALSLPELCRGPLRRGSKPPGTRGAFVAARKPRLLLAAGGCSAFPLLEHLGCVQPDELEDFLVA